MRIIIWVLAGLALGGSAVAQSKGDVVKGGRLAKEYCTACHNIDLGGPDKEYPPSFAAIARFRDEQQIRSRIYFPPYHANMPEFGAIMWPDEVDDLTAYIQALDR